MSNPLVAIHPSWLSLPDGVETSDSWRWFYLGTWADAKIYQTVLLHFAKGSALPSSGVLSLLALATEALTRSGVSAARCRFDDVEWARRTGLALFGAAVPGYLDPGSGTTANAVASTVLQYLLSYLEDGERMLALLAMPHQGGAACPDTSDPIPAYLSRLPDQKTTRLIHLSRERVTIRSRIEASQ